jgi:hypothetical protein
MNILNEDKPCAYACCARDFFKFYGTSCFFKTTKQPTHTKKNTKTHIHTHALLAGPHLNIQIWIDDSSYNQLLLVILPPSSFFASCNRGKKNNMLYLLAYIFWHSRVVSNATPDGQIKTGHLTH